VSEQLPPPPRRWQSPEDLVAIGFERSRVVMMNEAHAGFLRCARTREVGRRVLPSAHEAGVRHIAMEALSPRFAAHANATRTLPDIDGGYLSQTEMQSFIEAALALGWALIPYEVQERHPNSIEPMSVEGGNWRDEHQARNLVAALRALGDEAPLLVWCGNHHLAKFSVGGWRPMAIDFAELSGIEPFAIDQIPSVEFPGRVPDAAPWVEAYGYVLAAHSGAAGFLAEDAPEGWLSPYSADAFLLALDNAMS